MPAAWTLEMVAPGVKAHDAVIGGVGCLVCEPANARGSILYLHGGGYRLGSPAGWAGFGSRLAAATGRRVIVADYRLAPEHPFPAALHDAVAVYHALLEEDGAPFGGGLAAALAHACGLLELTPPAGLILLSPWLDLVCGEDGRAGDPNEVYFPRSSAIAAAELYLQGHDPADPLASPLNGELSGFPPTLLFASNAEYLLDDALTFQARLTKAGMRVEAHIYPGMPHVWPVLAPDSPEAREVLATIGRFLG